MFYKNLIFLVSFLLLCSACTKILPFPDEGSEALIVVNSFFHPDSLLNVLVTESCGLQDEDCDGILLEDMEVVLKDGTGNLLANLEDAGAGRYQAIDFDLMANTEYQLEINKINDPDNKVLCKSRIPKPFNCTYVGKEELTYGEDNVWSFEVEIEDHADEENYYMLEGYFDFPEGEHSQGGSEINDYEVPHFFHYTSDINAENQEVYAAYDFVTYPLRRVYLPDENFNGETYKAQFAVGDYDLSFNQNGQIYAHIFVKSVSKELYDYHKSLETHIISQGNFLSEPQEIASNVENGIGVFGGYTQQKFVIEVPPSVHLYPSGFFIENDGCTAPCTVSFSNDGGANNAYFWEFGDGATSTEQNPSHTYTVSGMYNVILTIETGNGTSQILYTVNIN